MAAKRKSIMTFAEFKAKYGSSFGKRTKEAYENYNRGLAKEITRGRERWTDTGPVGKKVKGVKLIPTDTTSKRIRLVKRRKA